MFAIMQKDRERTIAILKQQRKGFWVSGTSPTNEYNRGFSEGIDQAIKILETEYEFKDPKEETFKEKLEKNGVF